MSGIHKKFEELLIKIETGSLDSSKNWGGAGLVVGDMEEPESLRHKVIRATSPDKMSWIIFELCDIASLYPNFGHWKFEFFGQLANRLAPMVGRPDAEQYQAVVHEAFVFLKTLEDNNSVPVLPVAMNSEIVDDFTRESTKRAQLTSSEVRADLHRFFNH